MFRRALIGASAATFLLSGCAPVMVVKYQVGGRSGSYVIAPAMARATAAQPPRAPKLERAVANCPASDLPKNQDALTADAEYTVTPRRAYPPPTQANCRQP